MVTMRDIIHNTNVSSDRITRNEIAMESCGDHVTLLNTTEVNITIYVTHKTTVKRKSWPLGNWYTHSTNYYEFGHGTNVGELVLKPGEQFTQHNDCQLTETQRIYREHWITVEGLPAGAGASLWLSEYWWVIMIIIILIVILLAYFYWKKRRK